MYFEIDPPYLYSSLFICCSRISHLYVERKCAYWKRGGRDPDSEIRGWQMVETVLRLRRWQYLDADLYRTFLRIRERYLFLQVSTYKISFDIIEHHYSQRESRFSVHNSRNGNITLRHIFDLSSFTWYFTARLAYIYTINNSVL